MVDKLIRGIILEISMVLILVIVSIPVWLSFEKKISAAHITTLDDYNLVFKVTKNGDKEEYITVTNEYPINKVYTIKLKVNKKLDEVGSILTINNTGYSLSNFKEEYKRNNYYYTIVTDYITSTMHTYTIRPNLKGQDVNYSYVFEENTYI